MEDRKIKWSQWTDCGMIRCGRADYKTLMGWMTELGKDAKECLKSHEKNHAVYGRTIYDQPGQIAEVRFYADTYMDDDELIDLVMKTPKDYLYVAHK